jgi:hypothetical protein
MHSHIHKKPAPEAFCACQCITYRGVIVDDFVRVDSVPDLGCSFYIGPFVGVVKLQKKFLLLKIERFRISKELKNFTIRNDDKTGINIPNYNR